jgi:hypothetical protein
MEKTEHTFPAFIVSKLGEKHPQIIRSQDQMFDVKGMIRVIGFRIKLGQKTLDDPDK